MVLLVAEFTGWGSAELLDMPVDELSAWWDELQLLGKDRAHEQEAAARAARERASRRR